MCRRKHLIRLLVYVVEYICSDGFVNTIQAEVLTRQHYIEITAITFKLVSLTSRDPSS
jgi:hypothetical protein